MDAKRIMQEVKAEQEKVMGILKNAGYEGVYPTNVQFCKNGIDVGIHVFFDYEEGTGAGNTPNAVPQEVQHTT